MTSNPVILWYDIELLPLEVYTFRLGKQHISTNQLKHHKPHGLICISYKFGDEPIKSVSLLTHTEKQMVQAIDKLVVKADMVIGKNNASFDDKFMNTYRMLHNLTPMPEFIGSTDDLQKQIRKYFRLPSVSLDFVSKMFEFGGKDKMDMSDWTDLMKALEKKDKKSIKQIVTKFVTYCEKDIQDTVNL